MVARNRIMDRFLTILGALVLFSVMPGRAVEGPKPTPEQEAASDALPQDNSTLPVEKPVAPANAAPPVQDVPTVKPIPVTKPTPESKTALPAKPTPKATPVATVAMGATPSPASSPAPSHKSGDFDSVDRIKGIGKFTFGARIESFPFGVLRPVSPEASGILLRVSPYGDNYLVTDVSGLTWGNIPLKGLVVTFHDGELIDLQVALWAKKVDFYVADRAFKEKYGPSDPRTFPVETWSGDRVQVTLIFGDAAFKDASGLDTTARGKVELFDQGRWNKIRAAEDAKLKAVLDERYKANCDKVLADL